MAAARPRRGPADDRVHQRDDGHPQGRDAVRADAAQHHVLRRARDPPAPRRAALRRRAAVPHLRARFHPLRARQRLRLARARPVRRADRAVVAAARRGHLVPVDPDDDLLDPRPPRGRRVELPAPALHLLRRRADAAGTAAPGHGGVRLRAVQRLRRRHRGGRPGDARRRGPRGRAGRARAPARLDRQGDHGRRPAPVRRRPPRRPARRDRRDRHPLEHGDERLLRPTRADRAVDRRRLVPRRRHGPHGRRGLPVPRVAQGGHDHPRRGERLPRRDRVDARRAPVGARRRGGRRARRALGRDRRRGDHVAPRHRRAGRRARADAAALVPRAARLLQGARAHPRVRRPADHRVRQVPTPPARSRR